MRMFLNHRIFILILALTVASCASMKTVNVWKDETMDRQLGKVMVIAVAQLDFMKEHFEDVLSERMQALGIEAVAANRAMPGYGANPDRQAVLERVRRLGIKSVIVARASGKEDMTKLSPNGVYVVPAEYLTGWYGFYSLPFGSPQYDAEFFTAVTNIYDVGSQKLVWSSLSRVKMEDSRQGALNPYIDLLLKQMQSSNLF